MFLIVHSIQRPKGFKGSTCRQQDFIPTRMHGHKLCDVIDSTFVSDPHTIFQRAMTGDLFLGEDGKSRSLLYGCVCLLSLHRREQRKRPLWDPSKGAFKKRGLVTRSLVWKTVKKSVLQKRTWPSTTVTER